MAFLCLFCSFVLDFPFLGVNLQRRVSDTYAKQICVEKYPQDLTRYSAYWRYRGLEDSQAELNVLHPCDNPSDTRNITERRKKTVRFHNNNNNCDSRQVPDMPVTLSGAVSRRDWIQQHWRDPHNKDSGIDTSSTFTSSEDSNKGEIVKVAHFFIYFLFSDLGTVSMANVAMHATGFCCYFNTFWLHYFIFAVCDEVCLLN